MDAAVRGDRLDQALDRHPQPGLLTVAQHDDRQLVVGLRGQPGQRVRVRRVTGLRLLRLGQVQLAEEDLLELLGRAEVELVPDGGVGLLHRLLHGVGEHLLHGFQVRPVRRDAVPLQPGQQRRRGQLHVAQQLGRADLRQLLAERLAQVEDRAGLHHQRLGLGLVVRAEGQLTVGRRGGPQLPAQVLQGQRVQREGAAARLHQIRGERGVHGHTLDRPPVLGEDPHRTLGVVQHLGLLGVGEPLRERVLVGLVQPRGVEPRRRPVRRGQRDLGHRPRTQRPRVDGGQTQDGLAVVLGEPRLQLARTQDRPVQLDPLDDRSGRLGLLRPGVDGEEPLTQGGVADLQGVQDHHDRRTVVRRALQVGDRLRELDVLHHLRETAVELHRLQVVAEVLPGLALDLVDTLDEVRERTELVDPLRGRLLADTGDARQVVRRVTAQRREVGVLRRLSTRTSRRPSPE